MNWPGRKNSGPNLRSFLFLVGGTLGPSQVGLLLDEIPAMCLLGTIVDFSHFCRCIFVNVLMKWPSFGSSEMTPSPALFGQGNAYHG